MVLVSKCGRETDEFAVRLRTSSDNPTEWLIMDTWGRSGARGNPLTVHSTLPVDNVYRTLHIIMYINHDAVN